MVKGNTKGSKDPDPIDENMNLQDPIETGSAAADDEAAFEAALRYLAPRDRTAAEVLDHLLAKGFDRAAADAAVGGLAAAGYINDEDLCRRWIRRGAEKGRGRRRIARELADKGLSSDLVLQLLAEEYSHEEELAAAREQAAAIWIAAVSKTDTDRAGRDSTEKDDPTFTGEDPASYGEANRRRRQEARKEEEALRGKIARRLASQGFGTDLIYKVLEEGRPPR